MTNEIRDRLLANGRKRLDAQQAGQDEPDFVPVVKLFTPDAACTWLLTELDPEDPDIAFGLCDLGLGFPELGSVLISELAGVRGRIGLPVERDRHFYPRHTIAVYARAAWNAAAIVENAAALDAAAAAIAEEGGVS